MHSTKSEILALLKRADGASVDDLSSALGLASMTVRQHLTALERDGLVRAGEVRRPTGRPHFHYRLTEDGNRRLSEGYDRLVALLVDEAGHLDIPSANGGATNGAPTNGAPAAGASAEARRRALFRSAGQRLAETHRAEIAGLPGQARVERIAAILRSHGGFAEWHATDDGLHELRDFSCVFRATVGTTGVCDWHDAFIGGMLDAAVSAVPLADGGCADCCRYIIPAPTHAALAPRSALSSKGLTQ